MASLAAAAVAGGDRSARRVSVSGGISVRVPVGWHVLRGWLFSRAGAFVFVWEYLQPSRRELARVPSRPARFHLAGGGAVIRNIEVLG